MDYYKPKFTINEIGKFRFYSGIVIGLGYSVVLNLLFRFVLRISNFGVYIDSWNFVYKIDAYYSLLIGFTSVAFAFCYTTYLWMSAPIFSYKRKRLKLRMASINPIWIFYGVLIFLLRVFTYFLGTPLTIKDDFTVSVFLLPVFVYLYCWHLILGVYKCRKALFLISILIVLLLSFLLSAV